MSSLIFYVDPDQALIFTDTLVATYDGAPSCFSSKATYLAHVATVIAGTGVSSLYLAWLQYANSGVLANGVESLGSQAPKHLRELWARLVPEQSIPADKTATIYHFGLSETSGQMVHFAFRSTHDFEAEELVHGVGAKPDCTLPQEGEMYQLVPMMMEEQRRLQAERPTGDRIHIGGDAMAIHLTREGCRQHLLFRFHDYDEHAAAIVAACGTQ